MAFDSYSFNPGLSSLVYLPINGNRNIFTSTLKAGLSGGRKELDPCYGQYGILWKWSTFESSSSAFQVLTSTRTTCPSSWATMQCAFSAGSTSGDLSGPYPKKWILGTKAPSASFFNPILFSCSATPVIWTLSCDNWFEQRTIPLSVSNSFDFELRLFDYGLLPYTTSLYGDTAFTLNATLTVDCLDTENLSGAQTLISETVNFTAVAPPLIKFYTPNRFILSGTNVPYQNLITNISTITALNIDLDDGKTFYLTGSDLTKNYFNAAYDVLGFKTLKVTAYSNYNGETIFTETFNDILQVLDKYDEISPEEYRIATEFINLPWKIQPCVGSNDWAIEDNINNCFKQFHENLEYLDSRSKVYNNTYSDYFGYLGAVPTTIGSLTSIPAWTWEDADCFNTTLDYSITWRKLLSAETAIDTGEFVNFGTWEDQECRSTIGSINCTERGSLTGSECIDWNLRSRKSNTGKDLITWTDTTSASKYAKRWRFEICPAEFFIICNKIRYIYNSIFQYFIFTIF
jgi:hypothetical protein